MKKILFLILLAFIIIGCSKDDNIDNTEYYVKYEVSCQFKRYYGSYRDGSIKITGTGVRSAGVENKYSSYSWSDVAGPFKIGDKVTLSVITSAPKGADYITDAKISVCKETSPFVAKRWSNGTGSTSLSYIIE